MIKHYICTRDRVGNQITLYNLPDSVLGETTLVVPYGEAGHTFLNVIQTPPEIDTIGKTRQWLLDQTFHGTNKIAIYDDDLSFNVRSGNGTKLRKLHNKDELLLAFRTLEEWMDTIPLVAISTRQGNNTVEDDYVDNTRILRNFFINLDMIDDERFDRCSPMEDYDFELQLLRNGKPNRVLYQFSQDQPQSCSKGGAFSYRTKESQQESAYRLAELHPGFVRVTEKETKAKWFGDGKRTDVVIYWKKAFKSYATR